MRRAILAISFLIATGCRWGTVDREDFESRYGSLSSVPAIGRSFFAPENARGLSALLESGIGGRVRATSLEIRADRLYATAFDPKAADELNDYAWLDGSFRKPKPRQASADSRLAAFDIRDVPFDRLPEMVERARTEFAKWKGITVSVLVRRSGARTAPRRIVPNPPGRSNRRGVPAEPPAEVSAQAPIRIAVLCSAPRGSGQVEFDARGQVVAVR